MRSGLARQRLVAIFVAGLLLLNPPLLSLLDRPVSIGGLPLLYLYAFGIWLLLIVALFWVIER